MYITVHHCRVAPSFPEDFATFVLFYNMAIAVFVCSKLELDQATTVSSSKIHDDTTHDDTQETEKKKKKEE
jgi:hypothetical protein